MALQLRNPELHVLGGGDRDLYGDRRMRLKARPEPGTTTAEWVAGCRAVVAALSGTSARVYGRLPGLDPLDEATDDLCRRGIGHPLGRPDRPRLILGLTGAGGVTDSALGVDAQNLLLRADGREPRDRGAALTVAAADPAAWDAARGTALPWWYVSKPGDVVVRPFLEVGGPATPPVRTVQVRASD